MVKPLSMDLRERVLAAIASGVSGRQAAERFGVSPSSVSRWRTRERVQGDARPKALGGDRKSHRIDAHKATILSLLDETPDIAIEELRCSLSEGSSSASARSGASSHATRSRAKKDCPCRRTGSSRHLETAGRMVRGPARPRSRASRLPRRDVGINKYGADSWPLPARGAPAGWRTAWPLENHHLCGWSDHARHDRAMGARRPYQSQCLRDLCRKGARPRASARHGRRHGQPLQPQGTARVRNDRSCRCKLLYLPPYSPDFNPPLATPLSFAQRSLWLAPPIEKAFAKLKAHLPKAAERTVDGLWGAIGRIIDTFTPAECRNYIAAAGYDAN